MTITITLPDYNSASTLACAINAQIKEHVRQADYYRDCEVLREYLPRVERDMAILKSIAQQIDFSQP